VDWGGVEREENDNKISYGCGAVVDFCAVSCQAADFSHGDGTVLHVLGYAAGHETFGGLYFDTRYTTLKAVMNFSPSHQTVKDRSPVTMGYELAGWAQSQSGR
jgi:hypothetical protein